MLGSQQENAVYLTWYHFVWSVKYRRKVLIGHVAETTKDVITELCEKHGYEIRAIEIMPDHVHLFVSVEPKIPLTQVAKRQLRPGYFHPPSGTTQETLERLPVELFIFRWYCRERFGGNY